VIIVCNRSEEETCQDFRAHGDGATVSVKVNGADAVSAHSS
jgi:hypothetical protein